MLTNPAPTVNAPVLGTLRHGGGAGAKILTILDLVPFLVLRVAEDMSRSGDGVVLIDSWLVKILRRHVRDSVPSEIIPLPVFAIRRPL